MLNYEDAVFIKVDFFLVPKYLNLPLIFNNTKNIATAIESICNIIHI